MEQQRATTAATKSTTAARSDQELGLQVAYDGSKQSWVSYVVAVVTLFMLVGSFYSILIVTLVCMYYVIAHGRECLLSSA